jgi:hypothetical protein
MAPQAIVSDILKEAHGHILARHNSLLKTKEQITFYLSIGLEWIRTSLNTFKNVMIVKSRKPPPLLSPLPQCMAPNQRKHCNCFGPLKDSNSKK